MHIASIRVIIILIIILCNTAEHLFSQTAYAPRASASVTAGVGYGSYEGFIPKEFMNVTFSEAGTESFTNFSMTVRLLFPITALNSRLSVGAEWDLQMVADGGYSDILVYSDGSPVPNPDEVIHLFHVVGQYHLMSISPAVNLFASAGTGLMIFAHMETRANDESSVQLSGSLRMSVSVAISETMAIETEVRVVKSAGEENAFIVQGMAGLTFYW